MDLGAYAQIDDLDKIAKDNGIEVPRLRGYRLMKDEESVDLKEVINKDAIAIECVEDLCEGYPFWSIHVRCSESSWWTDYLKKFYLVAGKDGDGYTKYTGIRWDRIHGKKRKILKTFIHNEVNKRIKQWTVWNKYVGRDDILYIHSRIGGNNWSSYYQYVVGQPWFIEKVDDYFDSTYCDIYARIKPVLQTGVSV